MLSLLKNIVFTSLLFVMIPACAEEVKVVECDGDITGVVELKDAYFNSLSNPNSFPAELFTKKYWDAVERKKHSLTSPKDLFLLRSYVVDTVVLA